MFQAVGRPRDTRILLALALSALGLGTVAPVAAARKSRPPAHRQPAPSEVPAAPPAAPGVTVTMAPVGLSLEYPVMATDLGTSACGSSALAAELLRLGSPPLQLAGDSQDTTVPSGALTSPLTSWEAATLFPLPATFWSQLHCLLTTTKDPLTVGLNLKTGSLAWAEQMASEADAAATAGVGFSIGNEPDLYVLPNYSSLAKPLADEEAAQAALYLQLASALRPAIGTAPLIGPELAHTEHWRSQLSTIIATLHEQALGVHMYPLSTCPGRGAVTINGILSAKAADEPSRFAWIIGAADRAGVPAIVSEANSASCGGQPGVSDSPASAVWAVRFVLSALKTGFREVRFHFSGDPYDAFLVRGERILERPLEGAMVALNQWLPVGSTLRTLSGVRGLLATAVNQPGGGGVLVLDDERPRAQAVVLQSAVPVRVEVLSAQVGGVAVAIRAPVHGRIRLTVPANGIVAVSP